MLEEKKVRIITETGGRIGKECLRSEMRFLVLHYQIKDVNLTLEFPLPLKYKMLCFDSMSG